MSPSSYAPFRRATVMLAAVLLGSIQARALDPNTVFLKVIQAQPLVDGRYQVTLQWNALSGATYEVQGQEGLSQVGWLSFGLVTPATTTGQWQGTIAASLVDDGRFFMRLVLPREKIESLEPAFISTGGGVFYILGQCFEPTDRVFVNGSEATVVVFEDHTRLKVTMPAMAGGVYDVEVRASDGTTGHATLTDSLAVNATGRSDEVPPSPLLVNSSGSVFRHLERIWMYGAGAPAQGEPGMLLSESVPRSPSSPIFVRAATGEVALAGVDLAVLGRGMSFAWIRTYRSKNGPSTAQGEGWDFSYNISATQSGVDVVVRDGEGRADTFFNQGDGTWSRAEFFRQGTMSGTVFTLMFADKATWRFRAFDAAIAPGKIDRITDRNGNHLDCAYDGAGRLQTITDTLSHNYTVAYNGAGQIQSITDFVGRAVTYGYNAAGDLTSVTSPPVIGTPTGNDFPAGKTTTFAYSSGFGDPRLNHNLLTVTDALGQLVLTNTYAATLNPMDLEFDRCVKCQWDPGPPYPLEEVSFYYMSLTPQVANRFATTLTIINNHGNVSEVRSDSRNRPLEVREYTGRSPVGVFVTDMLNRPTGQLRASDPAFFTTAYDWNAHSCLSRVTLPRGGMIDWYYESDLTVTVNPREAGNLRVETTTAAPAVPSDFSSITRAWTHLPGFGTVEKGARCGFVSVATRRSLGDECDRGSPYYELASPSRRWSVVRCETPVQLTPGLVNIEYGAGVGGPIPGRQNWNDPTFGGQNRSWIMSNGGLRTGFFGGDLGQPGAVAPFRITPSDHPDPELGTGKSGLYIPYPALGGASVVVDLFGSNAAKAGGALTDPKNAPLYEAFTKGMVGSSKAAKLPNFGGGYRPSKLGANLVGVNLGSSFPTAHTDGRGNITTFNYDPNGNLTTITPPIAGTGHTFQFNPFGQPTVHIWPQNANGSARRDEFQYHGAGPQMGWLEGVYVDSTGMMFSTHFEYNPVGMVVRVVDPRGRDTLITPNALNQPVRIASREASAGVRYETDIRYDANNRVTSIDVQNKDETGALVVANPYFTTQYQYDALSRLVRVIGEVDAGTTITTERVIDANNHMVTYRSGEAVAGTQPLNTVRHAFDERGLVFQTTRAPGAAGQSTTQFDYDLDGNVAAIQSGLEVVPKIWLIQWDGLPRPNKIEPLVIKQKVTENAVGEMRDYEKEPTSVEVPNLVITTAESHATELYKWHEEFVIGGAVHETTDPMGNKSTFTYDANGNHTKSRTDGEHSDVNGAAGNVRLSEFQWTYDALNRPTGWTGLLIDPSGAQTGSVSGGVSWAPNSQPATATDPRGNVTTYAYDSANRVTSVTDAKTNTAAYTYDANGNLLTVTATDKSDLGNPNQVFVVTYTYDGIDRRATRADNVGNTTQYRYDSRSNLIETTDPRGIETRYEYDGLSRRLSAARDMDNDGANAADPQDIVTAQSWDRNSRLAATTNANNFVTTYQYDALNRRVGVQHADGTTHTVAYDVYHNVAQSNDANGTVVTYAYDSLNRLTTKSIAPGAGVANTTTSETCTYDGLSRLKSADSNGSSPTSTSYAYDSLSRIVTETQGAHTVTRAYDAAGNVTSLTYPGGNVVTCTYDALNRPLTVTDSVSGAIITHAYLGPDRIERRTHGNGTVTTYEYDGIQGVPNPPGDLGWRRVFAKLVTGPGGTPTHDARQFFYDANGNRVGRINVPINLAHVYAYDNADRLVNTVVQQGGPPIRNTVYALDKAGNRQNVAGDLHPGVYQMNPTLPNPGDAQMNQYTAAPTGAFTYDANGNRQNANSGGTTLQHVFDYANRLVAINNLTTAQPVAVYQYDALSRRVQKTGFPGGVPTTTSFVFDGGAIIEERDGGGVVQASLFVCIDIRPGCATNWISLGAGSFGPDLQPPWNTCLVNRGGNLHTLHADPAGSNVLLTNAAGIPAERYDYQDFGEPEFYSAAYVPQTGSVLGNPILFCSYRFDTESALYRTGEGRVLQGLYGFGGGGVGKVNVQDLSFGHSIDRNTPKLMEASSTGARRPGYYDSKAGSWITR